jgi:hypothetical protein
LIGLKAVSELWHTQPLDLCAKGIKRDSLEAIIVPGSLPNVVSFSDTGQMLLHKLVKRTSFRLLLLRVVLKEYVSLVR